MRKADLKPSVTLQHILKDHLDELIGEGIFNEYQRRIFRALRQCKTAALGEHWQACDNCGVVKVHYNSCGNRHCPQCQGANRERWLLERDHNLFDVAYHHLTFTVPAELRGLFKMNESLLYNILFAGMWQTLLSFSKDKRSRLMAEMGVISILHTWTQQLDYHPHLHCIVPSGGLTADGKWKMKSGKFLFSVKALSIVFKNKFCDALQLHYKQNKLRFNGSMHPDGFTRFIQLLKKKKWVVNSKPGFDGKQSVLEYLGRYTHKIAISNYRLLKLCNGEVTFTYRDRRVGDVKRIMCLPARGFLQRFSQHILPKRFVKIRHYGLFSSRTKKVKLALVRKALGQPQPQKKEKLSLGQVVLKTTGIDINVCSCCHQGIMRTIKIIPRPRGSPEKFSVPKSLLVWK
ncbi:MAG: IS91 family transposase [Nitrosomonadaceae bacterium]